MSTKHQKRLADLVMRELSYIIRRRIKDPRLEGLTVTGVKISADHRFADIYIYRLGGVPESLQEAMIGLDSAKGFIRRELAGLLTIRQIPELRFHLDGSIDYGDRIEFLLAQIHQEEVTREQDSETGSAVDL